MRPVDPEALDRAVQAVRSGSSVRAAAAAQGISHPPVLAACAARGVAVRRGHRPQAAPTAARVEAVAEEPRPVQTVGNLAAQEARALAESSEVLPREQAAEVLECLALGMCLELAAQSARVTLAQVEEWTTRASEGAEPWASWMLTVDQARASGVKELHRLIRSGRPGWAAAGWLLERTRPRDYGRRLEVSADVAASPLAEADVEVLLSVVEAWKARR